MIALVDAVTKRFKCHDLTLYMKSGNVIRLDMIKTYGYTPSNTGVDSLRLSQCLRAKNHLSVKSICLDQVEAIVVGRNKFKFPWG
jgi:hypothetical protein